jgi:hypothetical protein
VHVVHRPRQLVEIRPLARPPLDAAEVRVDVDDGESRRWRVRWCGILTAYDTEDATRGYAEPESATDRR